MCLSLRLGQITYLRVYSPIRDNAVNFSIISKFQIRRCFTAVLPRNGWTKINKYLKNKFALTQTRRPTALASKHVPIERQYFIVLIIQILIQVKRRIIPGDFGESNKTFRHFPVIANTQKIKRNLYHFHTKKSFKLGKINFTCVVI